MFKKNDEIMLKTKKARYPDDALRVHRVANDGLVHVFPLGGGLGMAGPADAMSKKFRLVTKEDKKPKWRKAMFSLDSGPKATAWHTGESWNGFGCPFFEKAQADKLAKKINEEDAVWTAKYDPKEDAYIVTTAGCGDPETFEAEYINVNGNKIKVYPIGNSGWCWSHPK